MKILISIGMVIIFISAFFIFFAFDVLIEDYINCLTGMEKIECDTKNIGSSFIVGLSIISAFILIDIVVVYIMITSVLSANFTTYIAKRAS